MITREQIEKHCDTEPYSKLLFATLDYDYQVEDKDYIIPAKTIVQVCLYVDNIADMYVNNEWITCSFPYDAATLLEDE